MKERPEKIRQILAQNIKKRREILGLTQEKLAELTDLSLQTINTIEGCRMWVSDKSITRLAKALNMEVFQLLVPYKLNDDEIRESSSILLLELRQKIKKDVDAFNLQLDANFKEALKSPVRENKEEQAAQKSNINRPKRAR
jgi:transcriptional regulator with XRE-family HTH domain